MSPFSFGETGKKADTSTGKDQKTKRGAEVSELAKVARVKEARIWPR
jgi:hypothetical protein